MQKGRHSLKTSSACHLIVNHSAFVVLRSPCRLSDAKTPLPHDYRTSGRLHVVNSRESRPAL